MKSLTIPSDDVKTRPGAPSELLEAPEKLLPAKARLSKVLQEYQQMGLALEEARAHLSRSETDEQATLDDTNLSDTESSDRIAAAQRSKAIYASRIASRESARAKLLPELKTAVTAAHAEFSALVRQVRLARCDILAGRIVQTARLVGRSFQKAMDEIVESSELILEIRNLEISSEAILWTTRTAEQLVSMSERLLSGYQEIAAKAVQNI